MELNLHLEDTKKTSKLAVVSSSLQSELKQQFRRYTDPGDEHYKPTYIVATLLDLQYNSFLNPTQLTHGKIELLTMPGVMTRVDQTLCSQDSQ